MDELEIVEAPSLPGFVIASSVMGFLVTVGCGTLVLTFIFWPMFW